jgi:hypothetical protein
MSEYDFPLMSGGFAAQLGASIVGVATSLPMSGSGSGNNSILANTPASVNQTYSIVLQMDCIYSLGALTIDVRGSVEISSTGTASRERNIDER